MIHTVCYPFFDSHMLWKICRQAEYKKLDKEPLFCHILVKCLSEIHFNFFQKFGAQLNSLILVEEKFNLYSRHIMRFEHS